jgi:solute carrier family 25 (mitochondrial phosphate transporter), member 3
LYNNRASTQLNIVSSFFIGNQGGGIAYTLTELFRRVFADLAGVSAGDVEVPIIICASGLAAVFGSFVICPFEAVRIRSVAQPDYAPSILGVLDRLVEDEGVGTLFAAVPVFLAKEIPFAIAKFTTFDLATAWMYNQFPAAQEDIQLSLLVSLLGGVCGGITAAIVSNPADATISEMKRAKSNMGPIEAAQLVVSKGGYAGLFRGLPLRFVFYSLMVSFQFLIYDAVRFALGIGSDDLKLYLDVLGGVLRE